jgi:ATP-binding protein involved in chromosome partitioning
MYDVLDSQSVLEVLRPVEDPELRKSLVELNMIRNVKIDGGKVSFTLVLTTPACPLREFIVDDCRRAVKKLPGVTDIAVEVTAETPQQKSLPDRTGISGVKNIIAISSGKGGVGKSTVAVNVAVALAQTGAKVGLLDADIYGPNDPTMLGLSDAQITVRPGEKGEILEPAFNHGVKLVSMGFLIDRDQPVIWRGPMLNGVIRPISLSSAMGRTRLFDCGYATGYGGCPTNFDTSSTNGGSSNCYYTAKRRSVRFS